MPDATLWLELKVAAAEVHCTHHAMFLRTADTASVPAMVTWVESFGFSGHREGCPCADGKNASWPVRSERVMYNAIAIFHKVS